MKSETDPRLHQIPLLIASNTRQAAPLAADMRGRPLYCLSPLVLDWIGQPVPTGRQTTARDWAGREDTGHEHYRIHVHHEAGEDELRALILTGADIVGTTMAGYTPYSTQGDAPDLALMRAMPNMTVIDPCDALETEQAVPAMAEHKGPVYMRLLRGQVPLVLDEIEGYRFELGKAKLLRDGADVLVISSGLLTMRALNAKYSDPLGSLRRSATRSK